MNINSKDLRNPYLIHIISSIELLVTAYESIKSNTGNMTKPRGSLRCKRSLPPTEACASEFVNRHICAGSTEGRDPVVNFVYNGGNECC
jgi:hypothetical protein